MRSPELLELTAPGALQARLEKALPGGRARDVRVGLLYEGRIACAALGDSNERNAASPRSMRTGCLTKLFTSALVYQAAKRGALRLDQDVGELLETVCPPAAQRLRGIRIADLLEHTHGLDDSSVRDVPLLDGGRIDLARLSEMATAGPRLCAPGTLHSYSHIGAMLLGSMLEQLSGKSFQALLWSELFAPLGIEPQLMATPCDPAASLRVCPSRGCDLVISVEHMLRFLEKHASETLDERAPLMTAFPGWSSAELGIRHGWKCYDLGWVGHNSEAPGPAAAVRVHPQERIAVVVWAAEQAVAPILAAVFGRLLPELVRIRIPSRLDASQSAALDMARYLGQYANEALLVTIARAEDAQLEMRVQRRSSGVAETTPFLVTPLRAAQDEIFFPQPGSASLSPFVQFTGASGGGFRFMWNGRSVWRNVGTDVTSPQPFAEPQPFSAVAAPPFQ